MKKYNKKILIVDDEFDIVDLLVDMIRQEFIKPDGVHTVFEATQLISRNEYDAVIVDIHLKGENGAKVIKYLLSDPLSKNAQTPIFILSGHVTEEFAGKYAETFYAVLSKPFDNDEIINLLKDATNCSESTEMVEVEEEEEEVDDQVEEEAEIELNSTEFESFEDMDDELEEDKPFDIDIVEIKEAATKVIQKVKKQPKLDSLFKKMKVCRDKDQYLKTHTSLSINIGSALARELHWGSDQTFEKIIYAAFIKDCALVKRPDLIKFKSLTEMEKLEDEFNFDDLDFVKNHPVEAQKICEEGFGIPEDVAMMVLQHHEMPDGSGFPNGITHQRITPLSSLFIIANDLADYIITKPNWKVESYVKQATNTFSGPAFRKVIQALGNINK